MQNIALRQCLESKHHIRIPINLTYLVFLEKFIRYRSVFAPILFVFLGKLRDDKIAPELT